MVKRINTWSSKCVSQAKRGILIKSVLTEIPSYIMSIPKTNCDREKMLISFWRGHNKNNGRLGFKNLRLHIVTRLFKAKYFPHCDLLDSKCGLWTQPKLRLA